MIPKRNIVCLTLLCFSLQLCAQAKMGSDSLTFVQLENLWNKAHLDNDVEALSALWADELIVTVPSMTPMSKEVLIEFFNAGGIKFSRYKTSDLAIKVIKETVIVTGRLERTRNLGGNQVDDDWLFTKTYIWRNNRWQVAAFHASIK